MAEGNGSASVGCGQHNNVGHWLRVVILHAELVSKYSSIFQESAAGTKNLAKL